VRIHSHGMANYASRPKEFGPQRGDSGKIYCA
jgi:hypothetical protein